MSRSYKKNKFRAITTAKSEKQNKRDANRKFRRIVKILVNKQNELLPLLKEKSNVWGFDKDGKIYDKRMNKKEMRK